MRRLVRFDLVSPEMTRLHELLWSLSSISEEEAASKYEGVSLEQYLHANGVREPQLGMACAGYANTVAGTLSNLSTYGACRQERLWLHDGDMDLALQPSLRVVSPYHCDSSHTSIHY